MTVTTAEKLEEQDRRLTPREDRNARLETQRTADADEVLVAIRKEVRSSGLAAVAIGSGSERRMALAIIQAIVRGELRGQERRPQPG